MTLDQQLADARRTFPGYPEEVFRLWLDDRIKANGWPPAGIEWQGFLFGHGISFWQSITWHRQNVSLTANDLSRESFRAIHQIVDAGANGTRNPMSMYIPNTVERFKSSLEYIKSNGSTPKTILLLDTPEGYDIVDGTHRVAALLAIQSCIDPPLQPSPPVDAWVARPPLSAD